MAKTMTLAQIRTAVRQEADMVNSQFVTDAELNGWINLSIDELYDLLVITDQDYQITSSAITVSPGTNVAALPATFYKFRGLDDLRGGSDQPMTVLKFNFQDRNEFARNRAFVNDLRVSPVRYRIVGGNIMLTPPLLAPGNYTLWFNPVFTSLVNDADTADGVSGWLEYVIVDVAIKAKDKEESSTTVLERRKAALLKRIEAMAPSRDQANPERVRNVRKTYTETILDGDVGEGG